MTKELKQSRMWLSQARKLIADGGWIQGGPWTEEGRCAEAALALVSDGGTTLRYQNGTAYMIIYHGEHSAALSFKVLRCVDPTGQFNMLWKWNDVEGRTKCEVLAAFDAAIADIDAQISEWLVTTWDAPEFPASNALTRSFKLTEPIVFFKNTWPVDWSAEGSLTSVELVT